jgi:adenylylsulfate kinase-like enzyme
MVVWITGLSGSGKTTLATRLCFSLRRRDAAVVHLDGDMVRAAIGDPHVGYDRDSRRVQGFRMARLAAAFSGQSLLVVASTVSLFRDIHAWNRAHAMPYFEVWVRVPPETLRARNVRGVYASDTVAGIDIPVDWPEKPDFVWENDFCETTLDAAVADLERRVLAQRVMLRPTEEAACQVDGETRR